MAGRRLQQTDRPRQAAAVAMALVAVVLWAATPIATKLAIGGLDPLAVGALRTVLAAPLALGVLLLVRLRPPAGRAGRLYLLCSALGGFVVFPLLFSLGMGLTTAAHGALVLGLLPLLTGLIAAGLERRALGRRWWLASAIALAGTLLLVSERFGLAAPGASLEGDLLIILSCFAAAAGYVAGARAAREAGTWSVTFWGLLIGGLVLAPLLPWILSPAALLTAPAVVWGALVYLAGLSSIAAYGAWYWALARDDIGRTGQIQYAQPVIGVALAAVILGEAITVALVLAGGMILLGVVLLQRVKTDRPAWAAEKGEGG